MLWMKVLRTDDLVTDEIGCYTLSCGVNERTLASGHVENYPRANGWEQLLIISALELAGMEEPKYMDAEAVELDKAIKNLLAILHRDGGHYVDQHGLLKSLMDAQEKLHTEWVLKSES